MELCFRGHAARTIVILAFLGWFATGARAQTPTLTKINPPNRTDFTTNSVSVTLTGTGFTNDMTLGFDPTGVITPGPISVTDGTTATVTFTINTSSGIDAVNVWVQTGSGRSQNFSFVTGVAASVCLEASRAGHCELRWEVDATSATGSSAQTNNSTAPNILVKLNYQWRAPLQARPGVKGSKSDHIAVHAEGQTGYTQVVAATKVQQTSTSGTTGTSTTCPGGTSSSTTTCTAAVPQSAYVANAAVRVGWSSASNDRGTFAELGLGARASFEYLIPSNKVVQNGGLTYLDLSSANPQNAVGFYEATGHFRLSQIGHNKTRPASGKNSATKQSTQNVSNLLVFEGGYQNNRGLQGLSTNSTTDTRNRYVARFYVNPPIGPKQTKFTMGMEYSAGINGGPHTIQLFFGTNLNVAKLFSKSGS